MFRGLKIIVICTIILFVLSHPGVIDSLFTFLFAGIVPGTNYELPFWAMCMSLFVIGYTAIKWIQRETLFIGDEPYQIKQRKAAARSLVTHPNARDMKQTKRQAMPFAKLRRRLTATS